jgi:hypothetical protein
MLNTIIGIGAAILIWTAAGLIIVVTIERIRVLLSKKVLPKSKK